jgi:hypothetical protein
MKLTAGFATTLRITRGALARSSPVVVHEDGALELIGNFRDQLRCRFLQIRGFLQQFSNASNAKIFQSDGVYDLVGNDSKLSKPSTVNGLALSWSRNSLEGSLTRRPRHGAAAE